MKFGLTKKGKKQNSQKLDENSRLSKIDDSFITHVFENQETPEEAKKRVNFQL